MKRATDSGANIAPSLWPHSKHRVTFLPQAETWSCFAAHEKDCPLYPGSPRRRQQVLTKH